MLFKIFTRDKNVLDAIIQFLHQKRLLVDYAAHMKEAGGFTQIIRVKCDEKGINAAVRPRFKKNFAILK